MITKRVLNVKGKVMPSKKKVVKKAVKKVAKKPIKAVAYLSNLQCGCGTLFTGDVSAKCDGAYDLIVCMNPDCKLYQKRYKRPQEVLSAVS